MKKTMLIVLALALAIPLTFAMAYAGEKGNGAPSGPHYNLNIIGVAKDKTADMTNSDRHTIFVALDKTGQQVTSRIYLKRGPDFEVCDGNAFDPAYDCDGNQVYTGNGAVFELPCNLNLPAGSAECGDSASDPCLVECTPGDSATYEVWARALGKPGGNATMTTCVIDENGTPSDFIDDVKICSMENTLEVLYRNEKGGKQYFQNVTNALTSLVYLNPDTGKIDRVALFAGDFDEWFWQYDNRGLKLAQIRFYLQ